MPRWPGLSQAEVTVILVAVCTQGLIDLFDTAQAAECTLLVSSCNIAASITIQFEAFKLFFFYSQHVLGYFGFNFGFCWKELLL